MKFLGSNRKLIHKEKGKYGKNMGKSRNIIMRRTIVTETKNKADKIIQRRS